jgi:hypothetical protein
VSRDQIDIAKCSLCLDERRGAEPWCLRCGTPFAESAPVTHPTLPTFRLIANRPGNTQTVYIRADLPEKITDVVQYLAYFVQLHRMYNGEPNQQAMLDKLLTPVSVGLKQIPEAQRELAAVNILDNMYRGAVNIQGSMDDALQGYVYAVGKAVAPVLSSPGAVYAYVLNNSFDNSNRFDLILRLLRLFQLVVICPEDIACLLPESHTSTKVRPLGLSNWPLLADEAWGIATETVRHAASERRPMFIISVHFNETAHSKSDLSHIRELLLKAGYTVVFRNEAPVAGSLVEIARPAVA